MKKIYTLIIICLIITVQKVTAQFKSDGFYLWNSSHVTWWVTDKLELDFANKDQYSNNIRHLEYYHFDLTAYRKLTNDFSIGLGVRQTESYKPTGWSPGNTFLLYGVLYLNPGSVKIKFANRFTTKIYRSSETIYGLDNITNVDFFARSTNKLPKPYLMDELFSNIKEGKIQTVRIYGGFRLLKMNHFGLDIYYCYWKSNSTPKWKEYNVLGVNTKFYI